MAERIPQSTSYLVVFRAYLSSDGKTPATGKTIAITISKNGATSFSNPNAGATNATEMASGFYKFTLDTTDTGTVGPLAWRGAQADINDAGDVLSVVKATNAGFSALPDAAAEASGGLYTRGTGAGQINQPANGLIDANVTRFGGTAGTFSSGRPEVNATQLAGQAITAATGVTFPSSVASPTNITAGTITTATNVTTVNGLAAGVITATSIAADAITAAKIADGAIDAATFAAGAINAAAIAADAITDAKVAADVTIASVTGSVGSVTGAVGSVTGNVGGNVVGSVASVTGNVGGNVTGSVGSIATGGISSVSFAAGAIDAAAIAADAIGSSELAASAITEIQSGLSTLDAAGVRTAVGLASANLDTQIGLLATASNLATVAGYIDTEVGAIKAKTDNLPASPAATGDAMTLTVAYDAAKTAAQVSDIPTAAQNADKLLGRTLAGSADGGRMVKDALRFSRNKFTIAGGTLTVYEEDDTTVAWTATITQTPGNPVSASDPA